MKTVVAIFFLNLILISVGYNAAVWVYYEFNIDSLTEEFCINKDKPELDCKGKCQIKKILMEDNQTPANNQEVVHYLPSLWLFYQNAAIAHLTKPTQDVFYKPYANLYHFKAETSFFKPPQS